MCYTKNQAETGTEEKVKNAHTLWTTLHRGLGCLEVTMEERFDTDQEHQPGTIQLGATQFC